ncbi:MAG: hydrogenase maturation protease [Hyphomicrobiaceae bacterium]|nr:hydrogenase maturation protease [Hyphomicrobiaceae bacterium]
MALTRPLVIGIGNPLAGDDAAGRLVARQLAARTVEFDVAEADGEATRLMSLLGGRKRVVIVDACRSGAPVGTVLKFEAHERPLPVDLSTLSSHGVGLAEAIEFARMLGGLPQHCTVYAIEGACFDLGQMVSQPVLASVDSLAALLREEFVVGLTPDAAC